MRKLKLKVAYLVAMLAVFSIGFYSCDDDDDNKGPDVTQQDRDFAGNAQESNLAEIRFGQLAVQRAEHDSVLVFANMMIMDHTAARNSLDSIANALDIELPDSMNAAHRTLYTTLSALNGFAFDSAYVSNQVVDHQNTRDLLEEQIDDGSNDHLVGYARRNLTVINRHLQEATSLRDSLAVSDTLSTGGK